MINPYAKVDFTDVMHWPYIIMAALTPLVMLACLLTVAVGGWFVGLLWIGALIAVEPEEQERYREQKQWEKRAKHPNRSRATRPSYVRR
jgi:hypothetical protein